MNPVPVMKLVEVIKGYSTSAEVLEKIMSLSKNLGKVPVEVNDYPGFVANKILMPMINEAIITLYEGVAYICWQHESRGAKIWFNCKCYFNGSLLCINPYN